MYLGWQAADEPDPGPPPAPLPPVEPDQVSADWLAAQRRERDRLAGPVRLTGAVGLAATVLVAGTWLAGWLPEGLALLTGAGSAAITVRSWARLRAGDRRLARQLRAEQQRVARFQTVQRDEQAARRREYTRQLRDWQHRTVAFARRPVWRPVAVPVTVKRVDVAGGTLTGWSALLTTLATARLAVGGQVTVIDLTDGNIATDLLAMVRHEGAQPLAWQLPGDLPRLDLGADFAPDLLADVLARTVAAADGAAGAGDGKHDQARDAALLRLALTALGDGATVGQLTAALRALGQVGGPGHHLDAAELMPDQAARLGMLAGRGAAQFVIDRAWAMEARLRALEPLATGLVGQPPSALRVVSLDGRAAPLASGALGAYVVIALAEALLSRAGGLADCPPAVGTDPWQRAVCLFGAERLPAEVLDRLSDAAEVTGTGLVLGYRSIPPHVRDRLGRGASAVAFMRLGNAADARLAAEQIGTEHRFVISQLTDTLGESLTDTSGGSYTSTVGIADSVADSSSATVTAGRSRGRGRSRHGPVTPFADFTGSVSRDASTSAALSDSRSITEGINASTSWGWNTSRALGLTTSDARTVQRSRELVIEQHEMQHLPQTAVVLCHDGPAGRRVLLADANPAIMTLPTATLASPARIDP